MDDRMKAEYDRLLTAAIIENGSLVDDSTYAYYGWRDHDDYDRGWNEPRHSVSCGIAKTGRVEEDATMIGSSVGMPPLARPSEP